MDRQASLREINDVIARGPYADSWDKLSGRTAPLWQQKGKFGIFIHWGAYSVPAFGNEWYPRNMYIQGTPEYEHHLKTYGPHKDFGYKDFIPLFRGEKFSADAWADLFLRAGARYVVPVAEHHDGFQMYASGISHWNAAERGPKRDVLGEISAACEKRGLVLGASSHRVEHWFFMGHGRDFDSDIKEPLNRGDLYWPAMPEGNLSDLFSLPVPTKEFLTDWLLRTCEIVDKYRPKLVYFDWWIQHSAVRPYLKKFAAYYYNRADEWGLDVGITFKHDAFPFGCAVVDIERGQFAQAKPFFWQTDTAIARNSWGYTEGNVFKGVPGILCDLMDVVSKNGCMLLNVGPRADGTITDEDTAVLLGIGDWLKVNGEAVYDTTVWRVYGEGPTQVKEGQFTDGQDKVFTPADIRFTARGGQLYATVLRYPVDGIVRIHSLAESARDPVFHGIIGDVHVLGYDEQPVWERTEEALVIRTHSVASDAPVVFRITMA